MARFILVKNIWFILSGYVGLSFVVFGIMNFMLGHDFGVSIDILVSF